ncbi:unnamed protein product [Urochloa humidicola]
MSEESTSQAPGDAAAAPPYNEEYLGAPGVRFAPTDQDLIVHYLGRKLRGEPLPTDIVVDGHDAYAEHPEKLVAKLGEAVDGAWYLFSPRDRKYAGGMRPKRDTSDGEGHWKAVEAEKQVLGGGADGKEVIGSKRGLTFHIHSSQVDVTGKRRRVKTKSNPTRWKMVEFVSSNSSRAARDGAAPDPMLLNDSVLCKITYRSLTPARRAPARGKVEEDGDGDREAPGGGGGSGGESQEKPLPEEPPAGSGGAGEQGKQQQSPPGGGAGNQQPATTEAPSGRQMAALLDDAYHGSQHSVGGVDGSNRSGTNMRFVLDSDDQTGAAYDGGKSLNTRRAGHQQAASSGGAGAGSSPDGKQQPKPEASNGGGAAANGASSEEAMPYLYDWELLGAANPSDWELYDSALASTDFTCGSF